MQRGPWRAWGLSGAAACAVALPVCATDRDTTPGTNDEIFYPIGSGGFGLGSGPGGTGGELFNTGGQGGGPCDNRCSDDLHAIVDCAGNVITECSGTDGCDSETLTCVNACDAANSARRSVGCEYYPTMMDAVDETACFAAVIANTWNAPAHFTVERAGATLDVDTFAHTTTGQGPNLAYLPFDNSVGLPPGDVAILFLAGEDGTPGVGSPVCPYPSAVSSGVMLHNRSGIGSSFRVTSDVPVVMYQINPYGGGAAAETGASLLLPTSAWGENYVAVNGYHAGSPSLNVIASTDDTTVEILPRANIVGGNGLPPGSANGLYTVTLDAGQHMQLTQTAPLTGSIIKSDKPVGLLGGARCSFIPTGVSACDHLEQMIPPVQALGHEYVGVSHTPRTAGALSRWRLIGAVDDTQLTFSADVGGPSTLAAGQVAEFASQFPFTVRSQDADHPFVMMALMSGGADNGLMGVGDPDTVLMLPPDQFLKRYVFFADPTYPVTNLVVVRAKNAEGQFKAVTLDCKGTLDGWQPLGDYEYTRLFISNGDFELVGNCGAGAHEIFSQGRFGLSVWGWGTPNTSTFSAYVSYGYPAGMNAEPINDVIIPPTPE